MIMFVRMAVQRNYKLAFRSWTSPRVVRQKRAALLAVLNRYKVTDK